MPENENDIPLDSERARLIGSIYEVVLRPEHFDSFMADWSDFVDNAARRLGELKVSDGPSAKQLEDPVIEAHFRRAFALFERMGRGETVVPHGSEGRPPLVRLGRGGVILSRQPEAETLFGAPVSLASIRAALDPDSATRLSAFLAALDRAPASGRFAVLSLEEAPSEISASLPGGGLLAIVTSRDPEGDGFVAEMRTMGIGWTAGLSSILAESFRLTPREVELVRELTRGGDLPAVSLRSGRSLNTLRAQLKSVFAKTRTGGQPELMRLVAALMLHGPDSDVALDEPRHAGEEIAIDVGDGRVMPVRVVGPEDGLPLVFVHGMLEGLGSLAHLEPILRAEGLRIYAPMRANFGNSYGDPRIKESVDIYARDLGIVLETLKLSRVVMMGHMAGAVHAFGAAGRLGRQIAGVANVAGGVPITSIEQFATMTPRQRAMAYTARFAPALLPAVLRAGIAQIDSRSAESFMMPLYPTGTRDRDLVERPAIAEALIGGYRFTVAQGQRAFHADAWHVTRDWSAIVAGSDCPVLLVHGALDPVVSLRSVRDFARERNRVRLVELHDEGQLLLYAKPQVVMAQIAAFARECLAGPG
ncbi:alpha/beta hydrolase [Pararhodobacter sp. CCB-MM2]|uniref:alpha/beta hydrolase n=1 Tax=Pararhodobacter sp. CCB-MM2 TaxID=1786003 RepID=UPI00082CAA3C|nr:alpha/beta hydrolase [Pararhodobacter sp. CCB-MM2]